MLREVHFLKELPHPNITPLLALYTNLAARDETSISHIYMVMPHYQIINMQFKSLELQFCTTLKGK